MVIEDSKYVEIVEGDLYKFCCSVGTLRPWKVDAIGVSWKKCGRCGRIWTSYKMIRWRHYFHSFKGR